MYGDPTLCHYHPRDMEAKTNRLWRSDRLGGGVIFVFVARSRLGEYELVHSTKRGEKSNHDWYDFYVKRSGTTSRR